MGIVENDSLTVQYSTYILHAGLRPPSFINHFRLASLENLHMNIIVNLRIHDIILEQQGKSQLDLQFRRREPSTLFSRHFLLTSLGKPCSLSNARAPTSGEEQGDKASVNQSIQQGAQLNVR